MSEESVNMIREAINIERGGLCIGRARTISLLYACQRGANRISEMEDQLAEKERLQGVWNQMSRESIDKVAHLWEDIDRPELDMICERLLDTESKLAEAKGRVERAREERDIEQEFRSKAEHQLAKVQAENKELKSKLRIDEIIFKQCERKERLR